MGVVVESVVVEVGGVGVSPEMNSIVVEVGTVVSVVVGGGVVASEMQTYISYYVTGNVYKPDLLWRNHESETT